MDSSALDEPLVPPLKNEGDEVEVNAVSEEAVDALIAFMSDFAKKYG